MLQQFISLYLLRKWKRQSLVGLFNSRSKCNYVFTSNFVSFRALADAREARLVVCGGRVVVRQLAVVGEAWRGRGGGGGPDTPTQPQPREGGDQVALALARELGPAAEILQH